MSQKSTKVIDSALIERLERAIREDGRYAPEAFEFLHRGLERAAHGKYGRRGGEKPRHVTGQELCYALRDLALHMWGRLAMEVLRRWNIHRTRDFGAMVYMMIDLEIMGKQDSDDINDFEDVYDFKTAFNSYEIPLDHLAPRQVASG